MWRQPAKLIYPNHPIPPWLTEAAPRDRSNRLLAVCYLRRVSNGGFARNEAVMHDSLFVLGSTTAGDKK
jgi:hypothetical protein